MKYVRLEQISPCLPIFETLASVQPFICNHHQTIKQDSGINVF